MKKSENVVIKETSFIAGFVIILSVLMEAVFLICGKWELKVLLGNVISAFFAILNFFLMGKTVEKAVEKDPSDAKKYMKVSQSSRQLMLLVVAVVSIAVLKTHWLATLLPLLFPSFAIGIRSFKGNTKK